MGILQRYVLRELVVDFSYTLSVITSVFFIALAAQLLYTFHEFNVLSILGLFPLLVPTSLAYTVPVSVMIATVLTFGRLTAEREILAMRTSGIHLFRVVVPALLLGLVLGTGTYFVNSMVIPGCHRKQTKVKQDAFARFLASFDRGVKLTSFDRFGIAWTKRDEEGRMRGIVFMRLSEKGDLEEKLLADSGRLWIDKDTNRLRLALNDGEWTIDRERSAGAGGQAGTPPPRTKGSRPAPAPKPPPRAKALASPADPPSGLALERESDGVSSLRRGGDDPSRPRDSSLVTTRFGSLSLGYTLDELFEPDRKQPKLRERPSRSLEEELAGTTLDARRAELGTEIHRRLANAFACFAFALIGAPLGILVRRGNRLVAFFVSFLVISLVYYPLSMAGEALGSVGKVPYFVSAWWANGTLVALGALLLRAVFRR